VAGGGLGKEVVDKEAITGTGEGEFTEKGLGGIMGGGDFSGARADGLVRMMRRW